MEAMTVRELGEITIFHLVLVGLYGSLYIRTHAKIWLIGSIIFSTILVFNFISLGKAVYGNSEIHKRQHLQTLEPKR